jgi:hypothetical protein
MTRTTYVADADVLGLDGEILVTVYDHGVTVAYRATGARTWGPPMIAEPRP